MKSLILFMIILLAYGQRVNAQTEQSVVQPPPATEQTDRTGFALTAGYGKYELINIGGQWNFAKRSSLSVFAGSNLGLDNKTEWSGGVYFDQVFFKPVNWKLKPGYSLGAVYWSQDDELYFFRTLSFPLMALLAYPVSPVLTIRAEGGVIFSSVLESDRKQNVESGYPERFNGNFRINIIYKLRKK